MKIDFMGVTMRGEPVAIFLVDLEIVNNGVYSTSKFEMKVSLPCMGIDGDPDTLSDEEIEQAKEMIINELKTEIK